MSKMRFKTDRLYLDSDPDTFSSILPPNEQITTIGNTVTLREAGENIVRIFHNQLTEIFFEVKFNTENQIKIVRLLKGIIPVADILKVKLPNNEALVLSKKLNLDLMEKKFDKSKIMAAIWVLRLLFDDFDHDLIRNHPVFADEESNILVNKDLNKFYLYDFEDAKFFEEFSQNDADELKAQTEELIEMEDFDSIKFCEILRGIKERINSEHSMFLRIGLKENQVAALAARIDFLLEKLESI
jgi:hypothetical protein